MVTPAVTPHSWSHERMTPVRLLLAISLIGATAVSLSCDNPAGPDTSETAMAPQGLSLARGSRNDQPRKTGLVRCEPLAYDSVSTTIGPKGGIVRVGPHRLWIFPGALREPVTITAVTPADTVNVIAFGPDNLKFDAVALLSMSHHNCDVRGRYRAVQIAHTDDALRINEYQTDAWKFRGRVVAQLRHFSNYAIAW
jgi:hypothetical protein